MKAIDRLRVRRSYFSTYDRLTDKTDKTYQELHEGSFISQNVGFVSFVSESPVGTKIYEGSAPDPACSVCGGGSFHQPPGDRWQCSTCTPPVLPPIHLQAGWSFCGVPDSQVPTPGPLTELTKPPSPPGTVVYLDEVLPDDTDPIGKCRRCPFTAHLRDGLCGACIYERLGEEKR